MGIFLFAGLRALDRRGAATDIFHAMVPTVVGFCESRRRSQGLPRRYGGGSLPVALARSVAGELDTFFLPSSHLGPS